MKNEKGNTVLYFFISYFSVLHLSFNKKGLPWKEPAIANL